MKGELTFGDPFKDFGVVTHLYEFILGNVHVVIHVHLVRVCDLAFWALGLEVRVQGLGLRVWGLGLRVWGLGFGIRRLGLSVWCLVSSVLVLSV